MAGCVLKLSLCHLLLSYVHADAQSQFVQKLAEGSTQVASTCSNAFLQISDDRENALDSIHRTQTRMQWWTETGKELEPTDKYLLFDGDAGGPNNIRIGWEMSGLIALTTGRTFVLPPPERMYLLDFGPMTNWPADVEHNDHSTTRVEDLINLKQLKSYLPTLTWEEFEARTNTTWKEAVKQSSFVEQDDMCKFEAYKEVASDMLFLSGKDPRREGFSCAEWWKLGGPREELRHEMTDAHWALLTHGFVWHPDVFDIAARVVSALGIFDYNAIHARYNDFQFTEARATAQGILKRWTPVLLMEDKLYVASDQPEKVRELEGLQGIKVTMLKDSVSSVLKAVKPKFSEERWFKLLGPVEEVICTFSKAFIGTDRSSFSGHINRMRKHAKAPITDELKLTETPHMENISRQLTKWETSNFNVLPSDSGDMFSL